ncbi:hypothetical protein [Haladaptatus halobius]|uniref:hypothetical protein n=1 Tax=Haladaptatus halobius TaxID=2884875 RepID=UPI001D0A9DB4|nr:hypothetical protein [Haladaptatus halobius]
MKGEFEGIPPSGGVPSKPIALDQGSNDAQPTGTALVFARDYYPGVSFRVAANLPILVTVTILNQPPDDVQLISQPDDYNGYVINYAYRGTPIFAFLFTRRYLPTGSRYRLGQNATYFSSNLNLIEAPLTEL